MNFPLQPLLDAVGITTQRGFIDLWCLTEREARTIYQRGWLTEAEADSLAVALGFHPGCVWPCEWFQDDRAVAAFASVRRYLQTAGVT